MAKLSITLNLVDNVTPKLNRINQQLNKMNTAFTKISQPMTGVTSAISDAAIATTNLNNQLDDVANTDLSSPRKQTQSLASALKLSNSETSLLITKLRRLASIYLGIMGAKAIINTADTLTSVDNKFTAYGLNRGMSDTAAIQFSADTQTKIFEAAQRSATGYTDMASNVAKLMTLSSDAFQDNVDNAIRFQEIMSKAYTIGGASAAEQASSMYQMVQALGSGILQGDELRSVREGAPLAYQAIEEFAQGVFHTNESLKELASQGLITSDIVVAAIMDMGDETDATFKKMNLTFAQLWTIFKNDVTRAFQPFLEKLREIANSDSFQFLLDKLIGVIYAVAGLFTWLAEKFQEAIDWIVANWDVVSAAISNVVAIGVVALAALAVAWIVVNWATLLVVAAISLVIWGLTALGVTGGEVLGAIIGAVLWLGAILYDVVLGAIMIIIIAIQAIVGVVAVVVATVIVAIIDAIDIILTGIKWLWTAGGAAVSEFVANGVIAFQKFGDSILRVLESIASAIDWVFGSNLAGAVSNWRSGLKGAVDGLVEKLDVEGQWANADQLWADADQRMAERGEVIGNIGDNTFGKIGDTWDFFTGAMINPNDAFNTGFDFGNGLLDGFDFDLSAITGGGGGGLNVDDYSSVLDDIAGNTGDTAGSAGSIADSLELSEEDLRYLRQIAEMEAINKFTTAEVYVEMNNNNNINGTTDLDGVVTYLSATLREELEVMANGVHA